MRVVYENQSSSVKPYSDAKQEVVQYESREYKKVGKSFHAIGLCVRIMLVADLLVRVTIGCLSLLSAAGRKAVRVLAKEISSGKERVYHYIPTGSTEKKFLSDSAFRLKAELTHHQVSEIQSAKFLVSMQFENGPIQKEYLIKTARTPAELGQQVEKIKQNFETNIDASRGTFKKIHWLVMVKQADKELFFRAESTESDRGFSAGGGGPLHGRGIQIAYESFVKSNGYPQEVQFKDGEFTTGSNYQVLEGI